MRGALIFGCVMLLSSSALASDPDSAKKPKESGFSIGALAGVGFPRPLSVEAMIVLGRGIGLGAEYSILPPITVSGIHASASAIAGDFRVFPLRGAFFIGVRGGLQRLDGGMGSESLLAETWFLNPRMGFMWTWRPGLAIGMEAGIQLPIGSRTQMPTIATEEIANLTKTLATSALPTVDLLRIGLML